MRLLAKAIFGIFMLALAGGSAQAAEGPCLQRDVALRGLEDGHGERPAGRGVMPNGQLVEIFVNPDNSRWTLMFTSPKGKSCMIVNGDSWRELLPLVSFTPQ